MNNSTNQFFDFQSNNRNFFFFSLGLIFVFCSAFNAPGWLVLLLLLPIWAFIWLKKQVQELFPFLKRKKKPKQPVQKNLVKKQETKPVKPGKKKEQYLELIADDVEDVSNNETDTNAGSSSSRSVELDDSPKEGDQKEG